MLSGLGPTTFEEVKDILKTKTDALEEDDWMYSSAEGIHPVNKKVPPPDLVHKGL